MTSRLSPLVLLVALSAVGLSVVGTAEGARTAASASSEREPRGERGSTKGCAPGMVRVEAFCIDRYEAQVVRADSRGRTSPWSPYQVPSAEPALRARSRRGVVPQAYISQLAAAAACEGAGKRLCTDEEWVTACRGPQRARYPYGAERIPGRCNDQGRSPLRSLHGKDDSVETFGIGPMNDPRLNQLPGTVGKTGSRRGCSNGFGVYDMVGNLHEWTSSPSGTFRGGYYLDVTINGEGCEYRTGAHDVRYHDYSVGFRCCADPGRRTKAKTADAGDAPRPRLRRLRQGESLSAFAERHHTTVAELRRLNQANPCVLAGTNAGAPPNGSRGSTHGSTGKSGSTGAAPKASGAKRSASSCKAGTKLLVPAVVSSSARPE